LPPVGINEKESSVKNYLLIGMAVGSAIAMLSPAEAAQGCGAGYHRGPAGHCRPNAGRVVAVAPGGALIVGNYYRGHGYWDGHRYWKKRYRHDNGWRYR